MVRPKTVFISQATELGTVYSKSELSDLFHFCRSHDLYLYIDGARLGSALASRESGLDFADLSGLCDVCYVGATKNGGLIGEAVVVVNPLLQNNFRRHLKQRGALLAKGRLLSCQFVALFRNGLYLNNADHANRMAQKLAAGIAACGHSFLTPPATNQIFPMLPDAIIDRLSRQYGFHRWSKVDDSLTAIRLVTSWATQEAAIDTFIADLGALS
jgi:threonine aldolase